MDNNTQKDDNRAEFISIISGLDEKGMAQALVIVRDIESKRIAGGKACMEELRKLEGEINNNEALSSKQYFINQKAAILNCISHAGELSPYASGFIETLAEYAYLCEEAGIPDLNKWKSEASMGHKELTAAHQAFAEIMDS